ncbi:MAG: hypothetical protein K2Q26_12535 [Bdellovibrionales bacterium]|nr:hypothetical protein [Bdellovibrionales bacterium]
MLIRWGMFLIMLVVVGGCATNCKLKGQVLGVLQRQNSVLDSLLKSRKSNDQQEAVAQNQTLQKSESTLIYGINSVMESNNKLIGGYGGSCD